MDPSKTSEPSNTSVIVKEGHNVILSCLTSAMKNEMVWMRDDMENLKMVREAMACNIYSDGSRKGPRGANNLSSQ